MREAMEIHQAIHGYAEGHTLLASSIRLGKRDSRTMLVLSDLAGSGGIVGDNGYLTGYPLPESGYYVLAKTWLAPEMRRPGCVWTHSLIIPAAFIDKISRYPFLDNDLFARPEFGRYELYKSPLLPIPHASAGRTFSPSQEAVVKAVLSALYTHPSKSVFFAEEDSPATAAVLGVWAQQWPALKARFRFCTSVASDRSADGHQFDLQATRKGIKNPSALLKSSLDVRKLRIVEAAWLQVAVDDVIGPSQALSAFFQDTGSAFGAGREAFVPMATLFCFLNSLPSVSETDALDTLEHPAVAVLPQSIKLGVIMRAVMSTHEPSPHAVEMFVDHLDHFKAADRRAASRRLGVHLVRTQLSRLLSMAAGSQNEVEFAAQVLKFANKGDLIEAAIRHPSLVGALVDHRPDILTDGRFLSTFADSGTIMSLMNRLDDEGQKNAMQALVRSKRTDIDVRRLRKVDGKAFWSALQELTRGGGAADRSRASMLVRRLCDDIALITSDLSEGLISSAFALESICHATRPDDVLNDFGADPWLFALQSLPKEETFSDEVSLMAYSLCRALGWRTRQPLELAALSLKTVYDAAKRDKLPDVARSLLNGKLPDSFFLSWDMCKRLRRSVADLFIEKRGSPSIYITLIDNHADFLALAQETADRFGGKSYLKEVRKHIKRENTSSAKLRLIDEALG